MYKPNAYLLIFCLFYLVSAIYLFHRLDLLDNLDKVIFSTPDSKGYLELSNYIVGKTSSVDENLVKLRPFLFPLFLSIHNYVGVEGYVLIQLILNILSIIFVFHAVRNLTDSLVFSFVATALMISSLTFTFVALHALTESLAIVLISITVYFIASYFTEKQLRQLFYSLFFLSAATCVKVIFFPFLVLWCCFIIYRVSKALKPARWYGWFIIALIPIIFQVVFTYSITGSPLLSKAGLGAFNGRYFPVVYGFDQYDHFASYNSRIAIEARNKYPSLAEKTKFLMEHIGSTIRTSIFLLRVNLLAESSFVDYPKHTIRDKALGRKLRSTSKIVNAGLLSLHILFFFLIIFCFFLSVNKEKLPVMISLAILTYSILLLSMLTYWQGDRIIVAGLPVWAVLYPTVAHSFIQIFKNLNLREGHT